MASIFSEPKPRTIAFATLLALFEIINISGQMDSFVLTINNMQILPEFTVLENKES